MNPRVLNQGIDTLHVTIDGEMCGEVAGELERMRVHAQDTNAPVRVEYADLEFFVMAHGRAPYRYLLCSEYANVCLTEAEHIPAAKVELTALGCLLYGPEPLYELMSRIVRVHLLKRWGAEKVARIDVYEDTQGFEPPKSVGRFVCSATFRPVYPSIENPETYMFGKDGMAVRVYNKTRELAHSGKGYMRAVWMGCEGYEPAADVWRIEGQLRRKVLKALGITTPDEAFTMLPELLRYCLSWCDHRIPEGKSSDRWPRHPAWAVFAEASGTQHLLTREEHARALLELGDVGAAVAGYIVAAAARLRIYDFELVSAIVMGRARRRFDGADDFEARARRRRAERIG